MKGVEVKAGPKVKVRMSNNLEGSQEEKMLNLTKTTNPEPTTDQKEDSRTHAKMMKEITNLETIDLALSDMIAKMTKKMMTDMSLEANTDPIIDVRIEKMMATMSQEVSPTEDAMTTEIMMRRRNMRLELTEGQTEDKMMKMMREVMNPETESDPAEGMMTMMKKRETTSQEEAIVQAEDNTTMSRSQEGITPIEGKTLDHQTTETTRAINAAPISDIMMIESYLLSVLSYTFHELNSMKGLIK
jgi:hypothetical protein